MPGRIEYATSDKYRYAYNGMETDPEIKGDGNSYTTEFRQYDPRIGRWMSLDPMMLSFPWMSPYVGFDNNPVYYVDPYGLKGEDGTGVESGGGGSKDGKGSGRSESDPIKLDNVDFSYKRTFFDKLYTIVNKAVKNIETTVYNRGIGRRNTVNYRPGGRVYRTYEGTGVRYQGRPLGGSQGFRHPGRGTPLTEITPDAEHPAVTMTNLLDNGLEFRKKLEEATERIFYDLSRKEVVVLEEHFDRKGDLVNETIDFGSSESEEQIQALEQIYQKRFAIEEAKLLEGMGYGKNNVTHAGMCVVCKDAINTSQNAPEIIKARVQLMVFLQLGISPKEQFKSLIKTTPTIKGSFFHRTRESMGPGQ